MTIASAGKTDHSEPRGLWGPAARTRMCVALAAWCAGSLLGWHLQRVDAWWWLAAACVALCAAGVLSWRARGRASTAAIVAATVFASAGWTHVRLHRLAADDLRVLAADQTLVRMRGMVIAPPELTPPPRGTLARFRFASADQTLRVAVDTVYERRGENDAPIAARGVVRVIVEGVEPTGVSAGDVVEVAGLYRPSLRRAEARRPAHDPDAAGILTLRDRRGLRVVQGTTVERVLGAAIEARAVLVARCEQAMDAALPRTGVLADAERRALMMDLVLGKQTPDGQPGSAVAPTFTRLGLAHALSISGFHLSVMAWLALQALRLTGERGRMESLVVIVLVLLYMLVVPPSSPVIRAGALTIAVLLGEALGRRYDRVTLLAWAAWLIVVWSPQALWSIGFQLTFALTAALVWLGLRAQDRVFGERLFRTRPRDAIVVRPWVFVRDKGREAISTALLCWAVGTPIVMCAVGVVNPWAAVASVLVGLPLTAALVLGYVVLVIGLISPTAAAWCAWPLETAARGTMAIASWMDEWPLTVVRVPPVSAAWALCASMAAAWWFSRGSKHSRGVLAVLVVALGGWLGVEWFVNARQQHTFEMRIDALSVVRGSSVLVRSEGQALLFDAGGVSDVGLRRVPDACRALGAWHVPLVIASGPATAAVLGTVDAAQMLDAEAFAVPAWARHAAGRDPDQLWGHVIRAATTSGTSLQGLSAGMEIRLGRCVARVLTPAADDGQTPVSLVIEGAGRRVLLVGRPTDEQVDTIGAAASGMDIGALVSGAGETLTRRLAKRLGVVRVVQTHDLAAPEVLEYAK